MDAIKERIGSAIDALAPQLFEISRFLKDNPETAYEEFKACAHLSRVLAENGFSVQQGVGRVDTAFLAQPDGRPLTRPTVALLAEYDALPRIGHGCGHNLIAAASLGAAIALQPLMADSESHGCAIVVGTPAEEGGSGKVRLAEAGVFEQVDAAMMFHPGQSNIPGKDMLGRTKFKMEFFGRSAHASGTPDRGINALDAMVNAYTAVNSLRQHLRPDGRIHGIITHGGDAPNIIPDYAAGLFYVRAASRVYRDELFDRVRKCAEGAALAIGATAEIEKNPSRLDPMKRNAALEEAVRANMEILGIPVDPDDGRRGSSDIGNLSHVLPCIHPVLAIVDSSVPGHSAAFCEATTSEHGRAALINAAKLLAMTACDFLTCADLQERALSDFSKE
jgi:amidohydrolase